MTTTPSFPTTNITNFITIILDDKNYLIWKNQAESILLTCDLFGYMDETISPLKTLHQLPALHHYLQNFFYGRNRIVYVDDILVTNSSQTIITYVINDLNINFSIKDLGLIHCFLGI